MRQVCVYLVRRVRDVLGYTELFSVVSNPRDIHRDAQRLYGRKGHTVSWQAWSKVPAVLKRECRRQERDREGT